MRSWPAPEVPPPAPGDAPAVAVHDTRSDEIRFTRPGALARLYVCGITPYDATHLGHAFTYLAFDLLIRAWREAGVPVRYVQNVTDIDDPLLERAARDGVDWSDLAAEQTELFRVDMASLSVIPPDVFAGAVESMPLITELIGLLEKRGAAYRVDDDLYFEVAADARFGELSRATVEDMRALFAERGGDPERDGKRAPLDCLLWRDQRTGEPGWDSPLGTGRPGWHVECTAIAREYLGIATSTYRGVAATWCSRTTRCPRATAGSPIPSTSSPRRTCMPAWSGTRARRCPSRAATSYWCHSCAPVVWIRESSVSR